MQRTTLLLSRESRTPKEVASLLLPSWFPAVWLLLMAKWLVLLLIGMKLSWWAAALLLVVDFAGSVFLPIPDRLYVNIFRRRFQTEVAKNPFAAIQLRMMLDNSSHQHFRDITN